MLPHNGSVSSTNHTGVMLKHNLPGPLQFCLLLVLVLLYLPGIVRADAPLATHQSEPVLISAQAANRWQQGAYEVWLLRGNCRIVQGSDAGVPRGRAVDRPRMRARAGSKVIAYSKAISQLTGSATRCACRPSRAKLARPLLHRPAGAGAGGGGGRQARRAAGHLPAGDGAAQPGRRRRAAADGRRAGAVRRAAQAAGRGPAAAARHAADPRLSPRRRARPGSSGSPIRAPTSGSRSSPRA